MPHTLVIVPTYNERENLTGSTCWSAWTPTVPTSPSSCRCCWMPPAMPTS